MKIVIASLEHVSTIAIVHSKYNHVTPRSIVHTNLIMIYEIVKGTRQLMPPFAVIVSTFFNFFLNILLLSAGKFELKKTHFFINYIYTSTSLKVNAEKNHHLY